MPRGRASDLIPLGTEGPLPQFAEELFESDGISRGLRAALLARLCLLRGAPISLREAARYTEASSSSAHAWYARVYEEPMPRLSGSAGDLRPLTHDYQMEVLKYAEEHGPVAASREYGVSRSAIHRWRHRYGGAPEV